ncbi:amino acid ABC transporter permease [uncultured Bilophila sp.]|uniref:amino acid ABC transporter permease n=1 Tax=uncultured Bilophila sp. TaxID=529385 RepID=UPI0026062B32|nr:amino acid ABC transporter permease [uncultured Bilophila sp.]
MKPSGPRPRPEWSPYAEYSRPGRPFPVLTRGDAYILVLLMAAGAWFVWRAQSLTGYQWRWPLLADFLIRRTPEGYEPGLLARGLFVTLRLGVWSMALALLIGGTLGTLSARKEGAAVLPIRLFVNGVRNMPPLVLLFLLYYFAGNLLPVSDMEQALRSAPSILRETVAFAFAPEGQLDRMTAAVLTLGIYEGAYVTEIVRGGIEGVPRGQWEASAALGFSSFQRLRLVILPQAVRFILPPLVGQVITTFKDSALASLISLPDLTFQALEVMAISRMTFEVWISAGLIYLLLGVACARYGRWLETRGKWRV